MCIRDRYKSEIFLDWLKSSLTDRLCYLTLLRLGLADWNVVWLDWNLVLTSWFAISDKGFSVLFDWVKSGFECLSCCFRQRLLRVVWPSESWFWMSDFLFQTKASPCSLFSCGRSSLCLGGHSQTSSDSQKSWSQMLVGFGFSHFLPCLLYTSDAADES